MKSFMKKIFDSSATDDHKLVKNASAEDDQNLRLQGFGDEAENLCKKFREETVSSETNDNFFSAHRRNLDTSGSSGEIVGERGKHSFEKSAAGNFSPRVENCPGTRPEIGGKGDGLNGESVANEAKKGKDVLETAEKRGSSKSGVVVGCNSGNGSEFNAESLSSSHDNGMRGGVCGEMSKRQYTRSELEALRFVDLEVQRRRWNEIHRVKGALVDLVCGELDWMAATKRSCKNNDHCQRREKKKAENPGRCCGNELQDGLIGELMQNGAEEQKDVPENKEERGILESGVVGSFSFVNEFEFHAKSSSSSCETGMPEGILRRTKEGEKNELASVAGGAVSVGGMRGEMLRRRYTRSEIEALKFVDLEDRLSRWDEIYHGTGALVDLVSGELDQNVATEHFCKNSVRRQRRENKKAANLGHHCGNESQDGLVGKLMENDVEDRNDVLEIEEERGIVESGVVGSCSFGNEFEFHAKSSSSLRETGMPEGSLRRTTGGEKNVLVGIAGGPVIVGGMRGEMSRRRYTRSEMEALRFVDLEDQLSRWNEIYKGMGDLVARELAQIVATKPSDKNSDHHRRTQKKKTGANAMNSGEVCFHNEVSSFDEVNSQDLAGGENIDGKENFMSLEEVCDEDENSDDDYDGIQKPAFFVEGEPDFESGPPEDGLEYLRRVRWEAAQIPKVKVVKIDRNKILNDQTPYMPNIPQIAKCPKHFLPSKLWEDEFLADFSNLRHVLARFEIADDQNPGKPPSVTNGSPTKNSDSHHLLKNVPTLSTIESMDAVTRAKMLRACIASLETVSVLSWANCSWLFTLCAAVDFPLNAEMGASLRCLLRKCASLRAQKLAYDDEVVMLNILVTITGKYFGQAEH